MPAPKWPKNYKACITITLDNMGEAADIHRGLHPPDAAIGSHYSVTHSLPPMLSLLATHDVKGTYFIESSNMPIYPSAIRDVASHGHEVAYHAWQHEVWRLLSPEVEVGNLNKSVTAAEQLGFKYKGFRPPGGLITGQTLGLMKERGFTYLSPAAREPAVVEGVAMLPFRWEEIDAYFYLESLAPIRKMNGDGEKVLGEEVMRDRLLKRVDEVCEQGGYLSLLFHPFLTREPERLKVMEDVVAHVVSKREEVWVARCDEVADWVLKGGEEVWGSDPGWDTAEWKKK